MWEVVTSQWLTWSNIGQMSDKQLTHAIHATYDQLPTKANLAWWGLSSDGQCSLCEKPGTLAHVMSGCSIALRSGRYMRHHNRVLKQLVDMIAVAQNKVQIPQFAPQNG